MSPSSSSLLFNLDMYFLGNLLLLKFESDRIIFVQVIVTTPQKYRKSKEIIQGQITQFRLTDFAHIQTWPVIPRGIPFPMFKTDWITFVWVIIATPQKLGKLAKFKGRLPSSCWPIFLIFELDLYFLWTFLFPKFETDQIIYVWVIVATLNIFTPDWRTDGRRTTYHDLSSSGLWPVELNISFSNFEPVWNVFCITFSFFCDKTSEYFVFSKSITLEICNKIILQFKRSLKQEKGRASIWIILFHAFL